MGIRSQVVLVVKTSYYKFEANAEKLLQEADIKADKDGYSIYVWKCTKWYPDCEDIMSLMATLNENKQYYSLHEAVETGEFDTQGSLLKSPFCVRIYHVTEVLYEL